MTRKHDKALTETEYYIQNFGANIYADFTIAEAYRKKRNENNSARRRKGIDKNNKYHSLALLLSVAGGSLILYRYTSKKNLILKLNAHNTAVLVLHCAGTEISVKV
ncbi:MAG: DUF3684 domain-containing protein [Prevotellaceae bacterium]|jgi:hypothetical protein|nr:DUF3684 domain-containing protein [Prevotellaceae bacterium]